MSFGFGVSDIINVSLICWKTWQACTSGRKAAPGEFIEIEGDLFNLSTALDQLAATVASEAQVKDGVVEDLSLEGPVSQCRKTIAELNDFLDRHRPSLANPTASVNWTVRARKNWRNIMWVTKKNTVSEFRGRISSHLEILNTLIAIKESYVFDLYSNYMNSSDISLDPQQDDLRERWMRF